MRLICPGRVRAGPTFFDLTPDPSLLYIRKGGRGVRSEFDDGDEDAGDGDEGGHDPPEITAGFLRNGDE